MAKKKKTDKIDEKADKKAEEVLEESEKVAKKTKKATKTKKLSKDSQPSINIGLVGHVDHGKTTLVKALSGKWTDTHSEEIKRGITIRLGYADATFYSYSKDEYDLGVLPDHNGKKGTPIRTVSFVDAPGHESLMATMLSGATLMDGALLMIAANEECPQPQTREHLMALEIIGIEKVIIVQNKVDLVSEEQAEKNYNQIKEFIKGTKFENAPIIPISARHRINLDLLIKTIQDLIPTPERDPKKDPLMFIARSFDINKPGAIPEDIIGGVLGGALKQGILKNGDEIEIRPGYEIEERNQKVFKHYTTKIVGCMTGGKPTKQVVPGGSIAVLTSLDPSVVKSDRLSGNVVGKKGKLPPVWYDFDLKTFLLERVVGAKDDLVVEPIKLREILMLNVNSSATVGVVSELHKGKVSCKLKRPVCAEVGSRVTISRMVGQRWRLIGYGTIEKSFN